MSVQEMYRAVHRGKLNNADRTWFTRWLIRYAEFRKAERDRVIPVSRDSVIAFLKSEKSRGVEAWRRQQAVRAIQYYLRIVQGQPSGADSIDDLRLRLGILVERESKETKAGPSDAELIGVLDENEAEVIRLIRRAMRVRHYARSTEKAYVNWVTRFIAWCEIEESTVTCLESTGSGDVKSFLTDLAVEENVSASTQNQALSALLFLFREVLNRELPPMDAVRASKPKRLPVVLSQAEIERLFTELSGVDQLVALLLYGSGMRLIECLRLRIKDVRFDLSQIKPDIFDTQP